MAVTIIQSGQLRHRVRYTITITADGSATITLPDGPIAGITFQSDGADGGGTLTWLVSNDETNFVALGVNSAGDPVSQTAVVSATAAGAWILPVNTLGWQAIRFTLAGSTSPNLVLTVIVTFRV